MKRAWIRIFKTTKQALNFPKQVWKYVVDQAASCSGPAISVFKHVPGKELRLLEFGGGEGLHRYASGARNSKVMRRKKTTTDHT